MNLQDYEWSHNPRGLQNKGPFQSVDPRRYTRPQAGWAALVVGGDEYVDEAAELVESGVTPIVRIHRSSPGAMPVPDDWYATLREYRSVGVRWFELYSEPNTEDFWPQRSVEVTWENGDAIGPLMDNWLDWAERIIEMGGYPAFPALAASADRATSTVYWLDAMLRYLKEVHADRFLRVVGRGLWAATHPRIGNHFYQEPPGGPPNVARPYYQQSADEGGWHFEYPYDPIMQHHDPGRTVFRGSGSAARFGDVGGLVAAGEAFIQLLKHHLDAGPVPVVGTAGGILPIPQKDGSPLQPDTAYPPYNIESHAEAVVAMWKWIVRQGPPWFFGMCLSDESAFYEAQGILPAIERMADDPPLRKQVPGIDTGGIFEPEPEPEDEFVVDGEATPIDDDEELPAWLAEAQYRADAEQDATGRREAKEPDSEDEPEPFQTSGFDNEAGEMPFSEAENGEYAPDRDEEGEIPAWLAEELPEEELQELLGGTPADQLGEESLEELIAIDTPEEPLESYQTDAAWMASEMGRPESEVEPDYEDLTGQTVDAWEEPETASAVPGIEGISDLPEDMQEELADLTGAEYPEELAEMTGEDDWEEDLGGDQPEPLPPDLEETEDVLLEPLGGAAIPPEMEDREPSGGELQGAAMSWEGETEPGEDTDDEIVDMTGDWSEEEFSDTAPASDQPAVEMVAQSAPDETPAEGEQAAGQALSDEASAQVAHHWLVFAPGVDPGWFFDVGWRYWQEFRPTVTADWRQMALIPAGRSVALTILARSEDIDEVTARIKAFRPDVLIDPVECDTREDLHRELEWRAVRGRRFG
mgnify:FL=1